MTLVSTTAPAPGKAMASGNIKSAIPADGGQVESQAIENRRGNCRQRCNNRHAGAGEDDAAVS